MSPTTPSSSPPSASASPSPDHSSPSLADSLTSYIRLTCAANEELAARRFVTARLTTAESVPPLLDFLFALQGRIRPSYSTLTDACRQQPLPLPSLPAASSAVDDSSHPFHADNVLTTVTHLIDGYSVTQATVFTAVECLARQRAELAPVLTAFSEAQLAAQRPGNRPMRKGGMSDESTLKLINFINRTHGTDFALVRRMDGGYSSGAFLLRREGVAAAAEGRLAVLKWTNNRDASTHVRQMAPIIARAVSAGYPTAPWIVSGLSPSGFPYHVQAFVPGASVTHLSLDMVRVLLDAFNIQRGFAPDAERDLLKASLNLVFGDGDVHQRVVALSPSHRAFHDELMAWVAPCANAGLTANDLVHGDLNLSNVLVHVSEGRVALSLIDIECMGRGSVMMDVANVLVSRDSHDALDDAFEELLSYAVRLRDELHLRLALTQRLLHLLFYSDAAGERIISYRAVLHRVQARCAEEQRGVQ